MGLTALQSAATGMKAMDTQLDVIANNIANTNTTGFKAQRANFEDLMYDERRQPGTLNSLGQYSATGLYLGLGAQVSNTQLDFTQGSLEDTGSDYDIAIEGQGFFKVQTFDGIGSGEAYTRAGNFLPNVDGDLVLGTTDGPYLEPRINVPEGTSDVTITTDGTVTALVDGQEQQIGQIQIFKFPNPNGLKLEGGNLYSETVGSGTPTQGNPQDTGYGGLIQGYLEYSNVDSVKELVKMIKTQRNFEMNSQSIKAADDTLQTVAALRN